VNTGDDWQKSQWLPPRLAQGTRVIRQVSCGRHRVGEINEDRSRLTVEQNVFSRALRAAPFKRRSASQAVRHQCCVFFGEFNLAVVVAVAFGAEMLHSLPPTRLSGEGDGVRHILTAQDAYIPPRKRRLKLIPSIDGNGKDHTCNHSRMASGKTKSLLNVRFGKRLGALRKEKGWTFVYLAEHSGLDDAFLQNLEHGTKEPCLNTIDILAKSFELSISELMRGV
jgi:hypothetical protein